ncbi:hypothetical protein N7931_07710 [Catenovulum sp. 2E275]|uniref:hypothetical protein n=1 Tax=Catenovulum sp. 2E275 TaxID=2980497 RepID=UPI0021D198AD|nr:hypothetical protein [Catenovulum sp. 2E275]MCU4675520.1 hypothetical protein [Catenovulum sp. 2E275]
MSIKNIGLSALVVGSAFIAGCGSDSSSNSSTYLTYYNLSPNKASVLLYDDDSYVTAVGYERTSAIKTVESGTSTIELKVEVDEDTTSTLYEDDLNLGKDKYNFLVSLNDLGNGGEEPLLFTFNNKTGDVKEDTFEFNMMYLAPAISNKYGAITVQFVDTEDSAIMQEFVINYKEKQTLTIDDDAEKYYIILKAGDETILKTSSFSFSNYQYFFALKDSKLNDTPIPALARLSNTTSPTEYKDSELASYFRVYNSVNDLGNISLKLANLAAEKLANVTDIAPDTLSGFVTLDTGEVGSYNVTIEYNACVNAGACSSSPYPFQNGVDKTIVYYRDVVEERAYEQGASVGKIKNIAFSNTSRDITDNHQITFVNLLNNQFDTDPTESDAVDIYFVRQGESIATTSYSIQQREVGEIYQFLTLPSDTYDIYLTYDDGDTTYTLFTDRVTFGSGQGEQAGDWIYIAEPATDDAGNVLGRNAQLNAIKMNDPEEVR